MDTACHVIGCHLTQESRVQNAFDEVASTIHQSVAQGLLHQLPVQRAQLQLHDGGAVQVDPGLTPG